MSAPPVTTTTRWTPPCDGNCDKVHRPYAYSKTHTSVTTLGNQISKESLMWGASKEAALFAVHHQADWRGLDTDDAVDRIRKHFRGVWDNSSDVGTLIHSVWEHWIAGIEWNEANVDRKTLHCKADDDVRFKQTVARMDPYVAGLAAFLEQANPQTIAAEIVLRNDTCGYIGTADWIGTLPAISGNDVWLLDIKTTSQLDPDKGMYLDSWRPQLAMYQRAETVVHYHGRTAVGEWPLEDCFPRPTRCGILHLRGDNGFQLIEVDTQAPIIDELIGALRVMHRWSLKGGHQTPAPVFVAEHQPEVIVYEPRPSAPVSVSAYLD